MRLLPISFIAGLVYATGSYAAIGPTASLFIVNDNISPDGFTRSWVLAMRSAF